MKPHRILIIEDEPNVRLTYRVALESQRQGADGETVIWDIREAGSAEAALAQLKAESFEVILLDLRLPGMNGLDLLAALRAAGIGTPVVMITAYGTVPDAVQAMKLGAIDVLAKPVTPGELREIATEVLHRHLPTQPPKARLVTEPSLHVLLAKRALNRRNFDEARLHLKEALQQNDRLIEAHNLLGVLCEVQGDYGNAKRCYGRALRIDTHYEPAQQNMRRLYELFQFGSSKEPFNLGGET
jgi:DNA-binding NtrC family response regulator